MIFLIIWPLLIHSSQQPSNLRDNSTHVCRIFSLVIPCIFGLFVDNFHLVLYMKRSLSWHFSMLKQDIARLVGWTLTGVAFYFFFTQKYNLDRVFWWHYVIRIYCFLWFTHRRARLHGVNELVTCLFSKKTFDICCSGNKIHSTFHTEKYVEVANCLVLVFHRIREIPELGCLEKVFWLGVKSVSSFSGRWPLRLGTVAAATSLLGELIYGPKREKLTTRKAKLSNYVSEQFPAWGFSPP